MEVTERQQKRANLVQKHRKLLNFLAVNALYCNVILRGSDPELCRLFRNIAKNVKYNQVAKNLKISKACKILVDNLVAGKCPALSRPPNHPLSELCRIALKMLTKVQR